MGIRTSHLQHHFQMDIWSLQQSSWLPLTTGKTPQDRPATVNMLSATILIGLHSTPEVALLSTPPQKILLHNHSQMLLHKMPDTPSTTPKSLATDRLQALLQMQKWIHSVNKSPNDYQTESTQTQSWPLLKCERITLQTYHRLKLEISGSCDT